MYNQVMNLYRKKIDNIYNSSQLPILATYGVEGTKKNRGGFYNDTKYSPLTGGMKSSEARQLIKKLKSQGLSTEQIKAELAKKGVSVSTKEEIKKKREQETIEREAKRTGETIEQVKARFAKERAAESAKEEERVELRNKRELLDKFKSQVKEQLSPEQYHDFQGFIDSYERDPLGFDVSFGLVKGLGAVMTPVITIGKKILKAVNPAAGLVGEFLGNVTKIITDATNKTHAAVQTYIDLREKGLFEKPSFSKRGKGKTGGASCGGGVVGGASCGGGKGKLRKLTDEEKQKLKEHGKTHSKSHIRSMRINLMRGRSFEEAHKLAMKKYGK